MYARNRTKFTLTGWILERHLLLFSPFHRRGAWTFKWYCDLLPVMCQGFKPSPGCACTAAPPVITPGDLFIALGLGPRQDCHMVTGIALNHQTSCVWILVPCICWASYFTPLNLNFLIYQMGIILVIMLQRSCEKHSFNLVQYCQWNKSKKITIIIIRWLLLMHTLTSNFHLKFYSSEMSDHLYLYLDLCRPSGKSDYIHDCAWTHISLMCGLLIPFMPSSLFLHPSTHARIQSPGQIFLIQPSPGV